MAYENMSNPWQHTSIEIVEKYRKAVLELCDKVDIKDSARRDVLLTDWVREICLYKM